MSTPEPALLARATDASAAAQARFLAARKLIDRGFGTQALAALHDVASAPEHALEFRKLGRYAQHIQQLVQWLDFAGSGHHAGRWETLDGHVPGTGSEHTGALLWLHEGARRCVIVFSNVSGSFGMLSGWHSIGIVHRVLKPLATNVIYMYDDTARLHFGGIAGLGGDYAACIGGLKSLIAARGWTQTYAIGSSAGGFGALRYGLDLEARAVLALSGLTSLDPADPASQDPRLRRFHRELGDFAVDLLPLYRARARRPRMLLCYGELNESDTRHARRMAELPESELIPFQGYAEHSTLVAALGNRSLGLLAQRLVAGA